jgi:hypothetical protein
MMLFRTCKLSTALAAATSLRAQRVVLGRPVVFGVIDPGSQGG